MRKIFLPVIILLFACFHAQAGKTEKTDAYGRTKLYNAASYDEAVKLIKAGADMRHKDCMGVEPLQSTLVQLAVSAKDYCKGAMFGTAFTDGANQAGLAKALLDNGVLNSYTHKEKVNLASNALTAAAKSQNGNQPAEIVISALGQQIILEAVNLPDENGRTALNEAVGSGMGNRNIPFMERLLRLGADVCRRYSWPDNRNASLGLLDDASIMTVYFKKPEYCAEESKLVKRLMALMQNKNCFTDSDAAVVAKIKKACPQQWADLNNGPY